MSKRILGLKTDSAKRAWNTAIPTHTVTRCTRSGHVGIEVAVSEVNGRGAVKGGEVAIEAMAQAVRSGSKLHLVSIGENSEVIDAYKNRCKALEISESVTFLGHQPRPDLLRWLKGCESPL